MPEFSVAWNVLDDKSKDMRQYAKQIKQCINSADSIMTYLGVTVRGKGILSLCSSMKIQENKMKDIQDKCTSMGVLLENVAQVYKDTENDVIDDIEPESAWTRFWSKTLEKKTSISLFESTIIAFDGLLNLRMLNASESISLKPEYAKYKEKALKKIKEKDKKKYYQKNKDLDWYEKKGTVFEAKAEKKKTWSLFETDYSFKNDAGEFNIDAKVATAEAHANIAGGFYAYTKDENGNTIRKFAPGVEAEIGASASLFELKADTRWGLGEDNNMLGVYGDGEVSAGKVSAKGKASVAFFDENGKVNPQVYGKAEAEAILAEAKGTAGVSVLGVDAGVSGSVNVGFGAHAEAGITDGKIKVDIGASVGIGVSVGFEVDIGGAVDAVAGAAESAWNTITSWKPKWW